MQSIMLGMPLQVAQEHKDSTHRAGLSGTGTDTILRTPYVMYHSTHIRYGARQARQQCSSSLPARSMRWILITKEAKNPLICSEGQD